MVSREAAAELTRKTDQNRKDIEDVYELLDKTSAEVKKTNTKVDGLTTQVGDLDTKVDGLTTQVGDLDTKVDGLTTRVGSLETKADAMDTKFEGRFDQVEDRFDQIDTRFDRLEALLISPRAEYDQSPSSDALRTPQEKRLSVLESKLEVYNGRTAEHIDELRRHERMFDAHDERFDKLDSQMAEVLGILRDKAV